MSQQMIIISADVLDADRESVLSCMPYAGQDGAVGRNDPLLPAR